MLEVYLLRLLLYLQHHFSNFRSLFQHQMMLVMTVGMQEGSEKALLVPDAHREGDQKTLLLLDEHQEVDEMMLVVTGERQEVRELMQSMEAQHHSWSSETLPGRRERHSSDSEMLLV